METLTEKTAILPPARELQIIRSACENGERDNQCKPDNFATLKFLLPRLRTFACEKEFPELIRKPT